MAIEPIESDAEPSGSVGGYKFGDGEYVLPLAKLNSGVLNNGVWGSFNTLVVPKSVGDIPSM